MKKRKKKRWKKKKGKLSPVGSDPNRSSTQ